MTKLGINMDSLKEPKTWVRFKIKDGSNIYRILPPFGDINVHNNYPYRKWSVCWLRDPETGKRRPYASPLTDRDPECPVYKYNIALAAVIEDQKTKYKMQGLTDKEIKQKLDALYTVKFEMNISHVYAYNAANKDGQVGLLELKSTAHKAMKKKMLEYITKYGQDPTSMNSDKADSGVWFNISKTGYGMSTEYDVDFVSITQKMDDQIVEVVDRSALASDVVNRYDMLGYDLSKVYVRKTKEELAELLAANLELIKKDVPEAYIEEFTMSNIVQPAVQQAEVEPEPVAKAPTVNLNLQDDDDDSPSVPKAEPSEASDLNLSDDLMAMADDLLKD